MSQERLTDLMFGMIWPPTSVVAVKQSIVDVLTEIKALRGQDKGLTEEEYTGWRQSILDELATDRHPESVFLVACVPLGLLLAGLLAWALSAGRTDAVFGISCGFVFLALLAIRFARGLAAKKRMTVADRLELVAELAQRELVSVDEATELGARIAKLAPGEPE
jgi:hypothetical protein